MYASNNVHASGVYVTNDVDADGDIYCVDLGVAGSGYFTTAVHSADMYASDDLCVADDTASAGTIFATNTIALQITAPAGANGGYVIWKDGTENWRVGLADAVDNDWRVYAAIGAAYAIRCSVTNGHVGILGQWANSHALKVNGGILCTGVTETCSMFVGDALKELPSISSKAGYEAVNGWIKPDLETFPVGVKAVDKDGHAYGRNIGQQTQFNLQAIRQLYTALQAATNRIAELEAEVEALKNP